MSENSPTQMKQLKLAVAGLGRMGAVHLLHAIELERRDARYGLATMCIGFGQAIAAVVERL